MADAILDIQCIIGADNKYTIKELSVLCINSNASQHWIFKSSHIIQNAKSRSVNNWLERHYHGLAIDDGDVRYEELPKILHSLKFKTIYVKGEQKEKIIKTYLPHVTVINLEEMGCPPLDYLCVTQPACCIFHMNLISKQCTYYKIFVLKKWMLDNIT